MLQTNKRPSGAQPGASEGPYRVMLVDDSAVIRGMVDRWLKAEPEIEVVASAPNGLAALKQLERVDPEVVVLDIEMPEMDGLTALPKLLEASPDLKVIMASTLTLRNAEVSLKALSLGAADYVSKPTNTREGNAAADYQRELIGKIKALGATTRLRPRRKAGRPDLPPGSGWSAVPLRGAGAAASAAVPGRHGLYGSAPVVLRKPSLVAPRVLAIGSSTGGPQALFKLFGYLKSRIRLPILVTQHMPPNFTTILADHLRKISGMQAAEAVNGEPVVGDRIYVAPGNWHMTVVEREGRKVIELLQTPPENFCRPAVDPMFRSLSRVYGAAVLGVVLTGMGHDGLRGGQVLVEAGGTIIGQDEATSVVWGMPGAVATGGLCSAVLPLDEVGPAIERMMRGATA